MTSVYDKPTWQLMKDAIADFPEIFSTGDMLEWFAKRYPDLKDGTVRVHLRLACVNVKPDSLHSKRVSENPQWPRLFKLDRTTYTDYRPEVHGTWLEGKQVGAGPSEDEDAGDAEEADSSFALEYHLEEFMEANWDSIDFGTPLEIWSGPNGEYGRQLETNGVGRIDFVCEEQSSNDLVVIELKRGRSSDRVVGQVLRYMGWVRKHLAGGRNVRGIIVTHEPDEGIRCAVAELPNVEAWTYGVSFSLNREAYK